MINGLEKTLEREHRWKLAEETAVYGANDESYLDACMSPDT
jgi:hypothetical protein